MKNVKIKISNLFNVIEQLNNIEFIDNKEVSMGSLNRKIKIKNENSEFCDVPFLIKKKDKLIKIYFDNGITSEVGHSHKFIKNKHGEEIFAKDICTGDVFELASGEKIKVNKIIYSKHIDNVYDLQINSQNPFYQTANGLIHHNTFCMYLLTKVFPKTKMLYLFSSIDILMQTYDVFTKEYKHDPKEIGIIQGNNRDDEKRITLLSIFSYQKAFHLFNDFRVAICDEVHETGQNDTSEKILYSMQNCAMKFGYSATPKHDNPYKSMKVFANIGPVIYRKKIKEQIDIGTLSKTGITIYSYPCPNIPMISKYADVYETLAVTKKRTEEDLQKAGYEIINKNGKLYGRKFIQDGNETTHYVTNIYRNSAIAQIAARKSKENKRVLILFNKIRHGENIKSILDNIGIESIMIHGKNDKSEKKEAELFIRSKPGAVVIASSIWNTGIDIEEIDVYINAGGGVSSIEAIQKLGRVIRKSKTTDKSFAEVIDFDDACLSPLGRKQSLTRIDLYENEELPIKYEQYME